MTTNTTTCTAKRNYRDAYDVGADLTCGNPAKTTSTMAGSVGEPRCGVHGDAAVAKRAALQSKREEAHRTARRAAAERSRASLAGTLAASPTFGDAARAGTLVDRATQQAAAHKRVLDARQAMVQACEEYANASAQLALVLAKHEREQGS